LQCINTFQGKPVFINPDQNHQLAIKVKTRFLEDTESPWMSNPEMNRFAPLVMQQIQTHQQFVMIQLHQAMLQQLAAAHGGPQPPEGGDGSNPPGRQPSLSNANVAATAGQLVQQGGASMG
jgi:hypothetical protein